MHSACHTMVSLWSWSSLSGKPDQQMVTASESSNNNPTNYSGITTFNKQICANNGGPMQQRTQRVQCFLQSINQSNFYSANIPGIARLSGATARSVFKCEVVEVVPNQSILREVCQIYDITAPKDNLTSAELNRSGTKKLKRAHNSWRLCWRRFAVSTSRLVEQQWLMNSWATVRRMSRQVSF